MGLIKKLKGKNPCTTFIIEGETTKIFQENKSNYRKTYEILIDTEDLPLIQDHYIDGCSKYLDVYYTQENGREVSKRIERFILGINDTGITIGYINGDFKNKKKSNLYIKRSGSPIVMSAEDFLKKHTNQIKEYKFSTPVKQNIPTIPEIVETKEKESTGDLINNAIKGSFKAYQKAMTILKAAAEAHNFKDEKENLGI